MKKIGVQTERLACHYLQMQGLILIECNYRSRQGEIDLIMRDNNVLVFVEVRYRKNNRFGNALESIDFRKQRRIIYTAYYYLQKYWHQTLIASRFDVVALTGQIENPQIEWIKDAFRDA